VEVLMVAQQAALVVLVGWCMVQLPKTLVLRYTSTLAVVAMEESLTKTAMVVV
jgi:hypothetical protein